MIQDILFSGQRKLVPHVTVYEVSVDKVWLEFGRETMLKRICTSMRDWSVSCLEREQLEKAIIIFRRVRIKRCNKSWEMLLGDADCSLPV
jgi:hypothetical protein